MRRRSAGCSLATTDIVNDFLGGILAKGRLGEMKNRRYFYATATDQMRCLLIDRWRHKQAQCVVAIASAETWNHGSMSLSIAAASRCGGDLEALDAALASLKQDRPRQFEIVQLKFFAGLANVQFAQILEVSIDTIKRDWEIARRSTRGLSQRKCVNREFCIPIETNSRRVRT